MTLTAPSGSIATVAVPIAPFVGPRARRSSGVFSLVLKPVADEVLEAALTALKVFAIGASWGGTRSLIAPMAVKGDRSVVPWTKEGPVLRISMGLEDEDDLWDDLDARLVALEQKPGAKVA